MEMTSALAFGKEKKFSELFLNQMPKQTVSSPRIVFNSNVETISANSFFMDRQYVCYLISEKSINPVTTREQLMLISSFFGFSKSKLAEIFGVTRQSIYNWINNTEPVNEHDEKIQRMADIVLKVDPTPSQPIFHVYINDVIDGYDKSLFDYLLADDFDKDIVVKLSKTVYEMSIERWKRIDAISKAKYRLSESSIP